MAAAAAVIRSEFFPNVLCFLSVSLLLLLLLNSSSMISAYEFRVGGHKGWTKPTGDELQNYNHWATKNRFHVGDSLYFKYEKNDSVLVVDKKAYKECNTTAPPLLEFDDGDTTFTFDRHGYFYFISGLPGHCEAGERLIVRVMVHPMPGTAPFPEPGGGTGSGSSSGAAAFKNTAAAASAVLMAALGSLLTVSQFV